MTAATTKGRPAATGRPFQTESRSNGYPVEVPTREYDVFQNQSTYARAELRSTTGTAPITFQRTDGNGVLIQLEDGSTQLYDRRDLFVVALGLFADDGVTTAEDQILAAVALGRKPSEMLPDTLRVTWTGGPDARHVG
ncbi:hypothetical protein [Isoptericola sp. G70]|uniref:hypothetical protein n=1 Tax=Isoptericola sp. G70 TaxID=3376633 RepID=UPI003A80122B